MDFDAIVVGSGISGGWVAKELCERGLKTLVIERGRNVEHKTDYLDFATPWEVPNRGLVAEDERAEHYAIQSPVTRSTRRTKQWWVRDSEHPYATPADRPFTWIRGYHLGGRSITWGRQTYRMSDIDFNANKLDGHGIDWPIRYADISPWYDRVERFAGISGANEGLEQLPDGQFLPPMELNCLERAFKQKIEEDHPDAARHRRPLRASHRAHGRAHRARPRSLPVAQRLRARLRLRRVFLLAVRHAAGRARTPATSPSSPMRSSSASTTTMPSGASRACACIDAKTGQGRSYQARVVFLCASTIGTTQILLASRSEYFPNGLANRSDALGRYLMDHVVGIGASGTHPGFPRSLLLRPAARPVSICRATSTSPRTMRDFVRGFGFQGYSGRSSWGRGAERSRRGRRAQAAAAQPGSLGDDADRLRRDAAARRQPRDAASTRKDKWGMPLVHIDCTHGENERRLAERANRDAAAMLVAAGFENIASHRRGQAARATACTKWAPRAWAATRRPRCSTATTRRTTSRTCSSPTARA